jgi:hypothetical protein
MTALSGALIAIVLVGTSLAGPVLSCALVLVGFVGAGVVGIAIASGLGDLVREARRRRA